MAYIKSFLFIYAANDGLCFGESQPHFEKKGLSSKLSEIFAETGCQNYLDFRRLDSNG